MGERSNVQAHGSDDEQVEVVVVTTLDEYIGLLMPGWKAWLARH